MISETVDRFVVRVGGRCWGRYRTRQAAEHRERQLLLSTRSRKPRMSRLTLPPWDARNKSSERRK